jgi:hypothetical protein
MMHSMIRAAGILLALIAVFHAGPVAAHGKAASMAEDICSRRMAGGLIHFAAYLPDFAPGEEFCDMLPKAGDTILVVDLVETGLREIPIAIEVVRDGKDQDGGKVAEVPARTYPQGVIRADASLVAGHYSIVVTTSGPQPSTYRYGFWVERTNYAGYAALALALLVTGFAAYGVSRTDWVRKQLARRRQ